jgi:hypothetical protein
LLLAGFKFKNEFIFSKQKQFCLHSKMYPTFYFGIVKKGESLEEVYERDRPKVMVSGHGVATQVRVETMELAEMTRVEALGYLHAQTAPWMSAKAVRIEANKDNVEWMWGVWIAAPEDLFADSTEVAFMSEHMIQNHRIDYVRSLKRNREEPVIFLRL